MAHDTPTTSKDTPTITPDDELLRASEAAQLLKVSRGYLRNADCPKLLLPSLRGTRKVVRYRRSALLAWAEQFNPQRARAAAQQDAA